MITETGRRGFVVVGGIHKVAGAAVEDACTLQPVVHVLAGPSLAPGIGMRRILETLGPYKTGGIVIIIVETDGLARSEVGEVVRAGQCWRRRWQRRRRWRDDHGDGWYPDQGNSGGVFACSGWKHVETAHRCGFHSSAATPAGQPAPALRPGGVCPVMTRASGTPGGVPVSVWKGA